MTTRQRFIATIALAATPPASLDSASSNGGAEQVGEQPKAMTGRCSSTSSGRSRSSVSRKLLAALLLSPLTAFSAHGQQTTGVPGSPSATTTIDGRYLPPPPQRFQGEINLNALQSKPAWPARVVPPKGAPNILLIMTRRRWLRRTVDFRWRYSHSDPGSDCGQRAALHEFPYDIIMLADARRLDHRPQSPLGGFWVDLGAGDWLPRL